MSRSRTHTHINEQGILVRCYHTCKHWLSPAFLAGWIIANTVTFPFEHMLWDSVWPFYKFADWQARLGHASHFVSTVVVWFWVCGILFTIYSVTKEQHDS